MTTVNQIIATGRVNREGDTFTLDNYYSFPAIFVDAILQKLCKGKQIRIVASITKDGALKIEHADIYVNLAV